MRQVYVALPTEDPDVPYTPSCGSGAEKDGLIVGSDAVRRSARRRKILRVGGLALGLWALSSFAYGAFKVCQGPRSYDPASSVRY